ncbi:hypothetical protein [Sorangium sp. So ce388]|uniref:hypothetical protein n=1 Tax=Sorangium sp. So ce388 TaxID=3133309 RepID=UPI003F5B749F
MLVYGAMAVAESNDSLLFYDPLTRLLSYDSFEKHIVDQLPLWSERGIHIAVGDVDDLRGYVTSQKSADAAMFGHLAGNFCMRMIGRLVRHWVCSVRDVWPEVVCGTFGGDEVIIAASGQSPVSFQRSIEGLALDIKNTAPRPCSFVCLSLERQCVGPDDAFSVYRASVSAVDRALFEHKERSRAAGRLINGDVIELSAGSHRP